MKIDIVDSNQNSLETVDALRERIKDIYPHLYEAAISPYVKNITHGKRINDDGAVVDQFFMEFETKEDQVMWNLMFSDTSNYNL